MANPVVVPTLKDVWTKVATNVTSGYIWILNTKPNIYLQTYRLTGEAAPTDNTDAAHMPEPGMPISSSAAIDVYIQPTRTDGSVRVDV